MARPRSDIAPRILRAARARFLRDGVDGASLRDIAREAATSVGMIHYYFPAKDDLFRAVVEEVYAGFSDDVVAIVSQARPLEDKIRDVYLRIARASDAEFDVLRVIVREVLVSSERRRALIERFLRGHIPPMLAALTTGMANGEIDVSHPMPAAGLTLLATAVLPVIIRRLIDERQAPLPLPAPEDLARALATVVFAGLRPR
jgi:AcrR family transcriptional regulator